MCVTQEMILDRTKVIIGVKKDGVHDVAGMAENDRLLRKIPGHLIQSSLLVDLGSQE